MNEFFNARLSHSAHPTRPLNQLTVRKGMKCVSHENELSHLDEIFSSDFVPCEDSLDKTFRIVRISLVRLYIGASSICGKEGEGREH